MKNSQVSEFFFPFPVPGVGLRPLEPLPVFSVGVEVDPYKGKRYAR